MLATALKQYWWIFLLLLVMLWVLLNYQRSKRIAESAKLRQTQETAKLSVGSKVVLDSGMHGTIRKIKDSSYLIEIAPGVVAEFEKYGVIFARSTPGAQTPNHGQEP